MTTPIDVCKTAVVIDLDGTLIDCNSFNLYVATMMWRYPAIFFHALMRKLRLISHAEAKRRIMHVGVNQSLYQKFFNRLQAHVRVGLLQRFSEHSVIILASAAPSRYVADIAEKLNITLYCATPLDGPENRGQQKLDAVNQILCDNGLQLSAVVTDHYDDLPLLKANVNSTNFLVAPSATSVSVIRQSNVQFTIL
jgi:phosphoserine phosphatase